MPFPKMPVQMFRQAELLLAPLHRTGKGTPVDSLVLFHGLEELEGDSTVRAGPVSS